MNICVIGAGYAGLVTGACFAEFGLKVTCVDKDKEKITKLKKGKVPFFEPGLEEMVRRNAAQGRLFFDTDVGRAVKNSLVVFICVGTPSKEDGSVDLSAVDEVAKQIGASLDGYKLIVTKSTVPVGTGARLEALIAAHTPYRCPVVSNPEFLKEGTALQDFLRPDRVVIGADDPAAGDELAELHEPFVRNNRPILRMSRGAAELTKYAANAYLATRISFINEIADICGRLGVDVNDVRRGIGSDQRIGHHFLYPGLGYGGSCFPKDVLALASFGRGAGADCGLLEAVHRRNAAQRAQMIRAVTTRLGSDLRGRRLAVWGLAFKPQTDDVREAPALTIIEALLKAGAQIAVHDPRAMPAARRVLGASVSYHEDPYEVLPGAEALLIMTEWMEFRSPDFERIRASLKQPLIFDGRNLYALATMQRYNFEYYSVGRPPVNPAPGARV